MRRPKRTECHFPRCHVEIRKGATMCTRHWRFYYAAQKIKGNENKPHSELIKIAQELEKQVEMQLMLRKEEWDRRTPHVHAG